MSEPGASGSGAAPLLRVVAGDPTPQELAVVVAVLTAVAASGAGAAGSARASSVWAAPARLVRGPVVAGPGAWRASALPR